VGFFSRGNKAQRRQAQGVRTYYVIQIYRYSNHQSPPKVARRESQGEAIRLKGTRTFTIDDLPQHTDKNDWDVILVPSFIHYFARYGEPWESNGYLEFAQYLWDAYFPQPPMILTRNEDAVYPLVSHNHYFTFLSHFLYIIAAPTYI
jgi:hypothetical protein